MGDCLGILGAADKNQKPGSDAGAYKPSRWAANSLRVYRIWENLVCVLDSLLSTAAKWSHRAI